ncbi:MAG: hypothetical protein AAB899_03990 [Patescibacteria group bacterium]
MLNYRSLFGWGIAIYAIMYLAWSGFVTYGFVGGTSPRVVALFILSMVTAIAGKSLHFTSWKDILPYSLSWAVCMAILNTIMSMPSVGLSVFSEPYVWVSYLLVVIVPLFFAERISLSDKMSKWHT